MSSAQDFQVLLVPMQLDAFVLNTAVCGTGEEGDTTARICPITQPNYTFLRLQNFLIQSDVQNHADLHNTAPAEVNSRLMDLGARPTPAPLRHRYGVYIHWTLPRFYRSGVSSTGTVPERRHQRERLQRGIRTTAAVPSEAEDEQVVNSAATPDFVEPPTRWVVVRKLDLDSIRPIEAQPAFMDREYEAWVVESDYLWSLDDIPADADLQTDFAPFVTGHAGSDINIEEQAEVFIGRKTPLTEWVPDDPSSNAKPPNISLLRSGNQLFADFQMHNSNVFSMLDNFEYVDSEKQTRYLSQAKASYYLLGWHWKDDVDPLWNSTGNTAHGASLDSLFMRMQGVNTNDPGDWADWLDEKSPLRTFCHGAMYDVTWDESNKPATVPADQYNARINDQRQAAVSVGTTPMDALISYCHARTSQNEDEDVKKLEEDILALQTLLHARDDGVEAQREANNTVNNWSFNRSPGGLHYHLSGQDDGSAERQPVEPEQSVILKLRELNQTQSLLDSCGTAMKQYRWDMFSLWWKFMSDVGNSGDTSNDEIRVKIGEFKEATDVLSNEINGLQSRMQELQEKIDGLLAAVEDGSENLLETAKASSLPVFYRANDPTVLIGGIPSGWPLDYLEKVTVRSQFQTISAKDTSALPAALKSLSALLQNKLPDVLKAPADALVTEFYVIRPGGDDDPGDKFYPQFHDQVTSDKSWRDQWGDRQPWFPLYVEWEAEYTHVPFDYWKLDEHTARLSAPEMVRYGIAVPSADDSQKPPPLWQALADEQNGKGLDTRILSGRVLILPQPSFSLGAKITQLFDNTPPDILDGYLQESERDNLRENISQLSYLSSPLSGFTSGMVTMAEGSHIKPENKIVSSGIESSSAIAAAVNEPAGFTASNIELIQGQSASTPYAATVNFQDTRWCPFKPVMHGQFRFRKLNIIDKFGQCLVPIDQNPRVDGPPPLYPCISDFYEPQTIQLEDGKDYANTVIQDNAAQNEFIQLPPQINQNARLNANFVKRITDDDPTSNKEIQPRALGLATWRPASEWENPIWGWVITNFADYGIQLFLPDGTFYREVRFGGPLGTLVAPKWLPFSPDDENTSAPKPETRQLHALAEKLANRTYLEGFWHMITAAQEKLSAAPDAYAQFLNSIVGKPLALVNMGWSLELDAPPLRNQSTNANVAEPECDLAKSDGDGQQKEYYQFQVRLGDGDAAYDGLVGYFDTTAPGTDELDLSYVKTFFAPEDKEIEPLKRLNTDEYPLFTPFWESPYSTESGDPIGPEEFDDRRNARMSVFGAIVDPFTPVHAYSSFLPALELLLPTWTWQNAMNTMTAFFHAGPLTVPLNDMPGYDKTQKLTAQNARDMPKRDLPLPSLGAGDWSWFEPYAVEGEGDNEQPVFNPFGIEKRGDLTKPGFQNGPYTAIEGFLQLRNPIMMPKN
ncbi:hypothetical protein GGR58DRAFT_528188 [Xylaria digitata]|nr:hypothetical protein GGR58DRAFT_528188 [Xylaria digitata]